MYEIPLSTLRKWEQGEASPAPYVLKLIAKTLPSADTSMQQIHGEDGIVYYYDKHKRTVSDMLGNAIMIREDILWTR